MGRDNRDMNQQGPDRFRGRGRGRGRGREMPMPPEPEQKYTGKSPLNEKKEPFKPDNVSS